MGVTCSNRSHKRSFVASTRSVPGGWRLALLAVTSRTGSQKGHWPVSRALFFLTHTTIIDPARGPLVHLTGQAGQGHHNRQFFHSFLFFFSSLALVHRPSPKRQPSLSPQPERRVAAQRRPQLRQLLKVLPHVGRELAHVEVGGLKQHARRPLAARLHLGDEPYVDERRHLLGAPRVPQ